MTTWYATSPQRTSSKRWQRGMPPRHSPTRKISAETSRDGPAVLRSQGAGADIRLDSGMKKKERNTDLPARWLAGRLFCVIPALQSSKKQHQNARQARTGYATDSSEAVIPLMRGECLKKPPDLEKQNNPSRLKTRNNSSNATVDAKTSILRPSCGVPTTVLLLSRALWPFFPAITMLLRCNSLAFGW